MKEESAIVRSTELPFGTINLRRDGILFFQPGAGRTTIHKRELEQMLSALSKFVNGEPKLFYTHNENYRSLGYAERKYIGENLHKFAKASAVIENSTVVRFIGHTINDLFPPKVPMRMFNSQEEAIEWLRSL